MTTERRNSAFDAAERGGSLDVARLFNATPGLCLVLSTESFIVAVTDSYLRATMTSREDLIGRFLFDAFPDDPAESGADGVRHLRASLDRVLRERCSDALAIQRYPIRRPESEGGGFEERFWSVTNHPVLGDDGEIVCIIHEVRDVTELVLLKKGKIDLEELHQALVDRSESMEGEILQRARMIQEVNARLQQSNEELGRAQQQLEQRAREQQDALRSTDERFRLLVEGSKEHAIFMLDREGCVISWNPGAERIKGYSEAEILGRSYSCFFLPEDVQAGVPQRELKRAERFGSSVERAWRVRKDGSRFWAEGVLTALYDADQRPRGYAKVTRDLTEQRRTEVVLQSIVDTAIDGIITIDGAGTIQTVNRAAETIFGYAAAEMAGRNVKMLMPAPFHGEHDGYVDAYHRTGVAKVIGIGREVVGRRKDGSTFPMELAVSRFLQGDDVCFTGLVRDVTARRSMEGQLAQAQKMEAVGKLAAGVAHDFNNLLTVISGYAEVVMRMLAADDKRRPMVHEILYAGEKAAALTHQLLACSRQQVLEPTVLDLNETVTAMEKLLRPLIGEHIHITTVLDPALRRVKVDPGQIAQVIMNLAVNARDAMPGGGALTIESRNVELDDEFAMIHPNVAAGPGVLMVIRDTGSGMTAEVASRIFEPFFTTKDLGKGTGLGLSVVDGIVRQSGGHIDVEAVPGEGAQFCIYLPAHQENSAPASPSLAPGDVRNGSETILLAEDETGVRDFAALVLERLGYTVIKAVNGAQALERIGEEPRGIDLLLTDMVMPEVGGSELAAKARLRFPTLKVLFISGYTDNWNVRRGLLQTGTGFLQKPFSQDALARKVRELLDDE